MKNKFLFLALLLAATTGFGQLTNVPSPVTTDFASSDVKGNSMAALTTDGKLVLSTDAGATFNLTTFNPVALPTWGAFSSVSVSFASDNTIGIFANQLHKNILKPVIYKATATGTYITKGQYGTTALLVGGVMNGTDAIASMKYNNSASGYLQKFSSSPNFTHLIGGGTYASVRGFTPTAITGNSCPGSIDEAPVNLVNDAFNNVAGISTGQDRVGKYSTYLSPLPGGALTTIKEFKYSDVVSNLVDITGGGFNLLLTSDGKILSRDPAASNCDPYTLIATCPSTSCKSLAYNGTKLIVGASGSVFTFSGTTWTSHPTPGVDINKVLVCSGVGFAYGTGGKIFKVVF